MPTNLGFGQAECEGENDQGEEKERHVSLKVASPD